jgi:hypothetical protein
MLYQANKTNMNPTFLFSPNGTVQPSVTYSTCETYECRCPHSSYPIATPGNAKISCLNLESVSWNLQVISKHTQSHQLHGASSTFVTIFALSNSYALAASFSLSMSTISLGVKKASRSLI